MRGRGAKLKRKERKINLKGGGGGEGGGARVDAWCLRGVRGWVGSGKGLQRSKCKSV